jgi:protein SCO1/2
MYSQLSEADLSNDVSTLLVSVDPERDTTERLKDYVKYFNESFTGVTGTPEELRKFAEQVSVVYSIPKDRSDANYLVDHSSTVILINPDGAVQAIFSPPQTADALAKDFRLLVAHYNSF